MPQLAACLCCTSSSHWRRYGRAPHRCRVKRGERSASFHELRLEYEHALAAPAWPPPELEASSSEDSRERYVSTSALRRVREYIKVNRGDVAQGMPRLGIAIA